MAIRSHIDKATKQLRGAMRYALKTGAVSIRTADGPVTLPVGDRAMVGIVVVREMFDDDYGACSKPVLEFARALERPAVLLDYPGLHTLAQRLVAPEQFINGLGRMFEMALAKDEFPKPVLAWPADAGLIATGPCTRSCVICERYAGTRMRPWTDVLLFVGPRRPAAVPR